MSKSKSEARAKRKRSIRKRIFGTAERPRVSVFRSIKQTYAQVIDDDTGKTLVAASTMENEIAGQGKNKTERAAAVGQYLAERCLAAGLSRVVFDRNGYLYHGRVRAVAEAARKAGLEL